MVLEKEKENLPNIRKSVEDELKPYVKRNVMTSMTDGMIDAIANGMIPLQTVIVYFISSYVGSNFLVGLLTTVQLLFSAVPQLITAKYMNGLGYYKRVMGTFVAISRAQSLIIGLLILFVAPRNRMLFVILFYAVYWLNGFTHGCEGISYSVFINKVIPFKVRGRFFGIRGIFCGVGSIIGSLVFGVILASGDSTLNYAILFLVSYGIDMFSYIFLVAAFEPKTSVSRESAGINGDFKTKIKAIVKNDKNLVTYIIAFSLVMFAVSTVFFETLYAKSNYGLTTTQLTNMTTIIFVSQSAGYFLWGMLIDKFGFKCALLGGYSMYILNLLLAVFVNTPFVIFALAAIYGFTCSVEMIGGRNFLYNICTYDNRPAYVSIANTVIVPVTALAPVINGILFDFIGFKFMCIINLAVLAIGVAFFLKVKEKVVYQG
jgi:MFS family permease